MPFESRKDVLGAISLALNTDFLTFDAKTKKYIPTHACLYREDFVASTKKNWQHWESHLVWHEDSLEELIPVAKVVSCFRPLYIVDRLSKKIGVEVRDLISAESPYHGSIVYLHGDMRQISTFAQALRENGGDYWSDDKA